MGEREKLAQKESDRKIDVNPHAPIMSEEAREAAKEQAKERWVAYMPCIHFRIVWKAAKDIHVLYCIYVDIDCPILHAIKELYFSQ